MFMFLAQIARSVANEFMRLSTPVLAILERYPTGQDKTAFARRTRVEPNK